jgi:transposase
MAMKRQTYTAEFKRQAVRMMLDQGLSAAEAARQLGVSEKRLQQWRQAFRERGEEAFPGHGHQSPADDELRRLRVEVVRLRAERDLLKKAAAYFASPPS